VAKIIAVSLIAFISVAISVAIIGLIFLKRRKREEEDGVELPTRVAKPKKKPVVTEYGPLNGIHQSEEDEEPSCDGIDSNYQNLDEHMQNGQKKGDSNYQNLSDCGPQANGETSGSDEEPEYRDLKDFDVYRAKHPVS